MGAWVDIPGANAVTFNDSGLTPLTTERYRREVRDVQGQTALSNELTITTGPVLAGGTIAQGTVTSSTIAITSVAAASGGDPTITYRWLRKTTGAYAYITGTAATLSDTALSALTTYTYKREATDAVLAVQYSNELAVTTLAVAALTGGTISETSHAATQVVLQSDVAAAGGVAPIIYQWKRKTGAGAYGDLAGQTAATCTDNTPVAATTYTYKRTATDAVASTADSNAVTVTTSAAPSVAFDASSNQTIFDNLGPFTVSHTFGSLTHGICLVAVGTNELQTDQVTAVSIDDGGTPIALAVVPGALKGAAAISSGVAGCVDWWYTLTMPSAGTHTITATVNATKIVTIGALTFQHVNQSSPFNTNLLNSAAVGWASPDTENITSAADEYAVGAWLTGTSGITDIATTDTLFWKQRDTLSFDGMTFLVAGKAGASPAALNFSNSNAASYGFAFSGFSLKSG